MREIKDSIVVSEEVLSKYEMVATVENSELASVSWIWTCWVHQLLPRDGKCLLIRQFYLVVREGVLSDRLGAVAVGLVTDNRTVHGSQVVL